MKNEGGAGVACRLVLPDGRTVTFTMPGRLVTFGAADKVRAPKKERK